MPLTMRSFKGLVPLFVLWTVQFAGPSAAQVSSVIDPASGAQLPSVFGQTPERPSARPLGELLPAAEIEDSFELPTLPDSIESTALPESLGVLVKRFEFMGNTAIADEVLRSALDRLIDRPLTATHLIEARDLITQIYVDAGFITSGARVPDQPIRNGVIAFEIVEGELEDLEVRGLSRFREAYFETRARAAARTPLNLERLEAMLQRIQRDPLIEKVAARLEPGSAPGQSRLTLVMTEARQEDIQLSFHNDRSTSIGEETGELHATVSNILGHRDQIYAAGRISEGLRDLEFQWQIPVNASDTLLETRVRWTRSEVVEFPFDPLNIESESLLVSLGLSHPIYRTKSHSLRLGLRADWRKGRSTLDDRLFCFQPGVTDCTPTIAVLRGIGEWRYEGRDRAAAIRSTLSWGTGLLGATTRAGNVPDGRFVAFLAQMQWAERLAFDSRLLTRFDIQLTDDPLLSFERISVGGAQSVRGYRPNQLVRDSGLSASVEWRIPVWKRSLGAAYLEIVPFWDLGHAWNERFDAGDNTISSVGLGLLANPHERISFSAHWGARLLGVDRIGNGLIDSGLHLQVVVDAW